MSEDPRHPWGTGKTHYNWRPDVHEIVQLALNRYPMLTANSYTCHPWCGWGDQSVDFWGSEGRGDPAPIDASRSLRRFLMNLPGEPLIRHTILDHLLWTAWGGYSEWSRNDHTGKLRHLHITYY